MTHSTASAVDLPVEPNSRVLTTQIWTLTGVLTVAGCSVATMPTSAIFISPFA
jgi:hypothetical protein